MKIRLVIFWVIASFGLAVLNYFYNPTILLAAIGTLVQLVLLAFLVWSLAKVGFGARGLVVTLIISLVAGFMVSKAFDVAYRLLSAPEGLRFVLPIEVALFGLVLALGAVASRFVLGSKEEK